jgi:hypothetical protein
MRAALLAMATVTSWSGNVWNNAALKSVFSALKTERTARRADHMRDDARADVVDDLERFDNAARRSATAAPSRSRTTPGSLRPLSAKPATGRTECRDQTLSAES